MRKAWRLALFVAFHILLVESAKVSPKLDFGSEEGQVQVKKEIRGGKIKGLRVTVDTSELKESKSSNSDSSSSNESSSSEKKKTVGVRTDVTFELTSGEVNDTKTVDEKEIGKDDDNASIPIVPVFKGKPDRGSNVEPKDPNFNELWSVKPLENSNTGGPVFHGVDDRDRYGGAVDDSWKQVPQYSIWTTERNNNRRPDQPVYHHRDPQINNIHKPSPNFIPYQIHHDRHLIHQPCTCKEYPGPYVPGQSDKPYGSPQNQPDRHYGYPQPQPDRPYGFPQHDRPYGHPQPDRPFVRPQPQPDRPFISPHPQPEYPTKVDDKLERPFSKTS